MRFLIIDAGGAGLDIALRAQQHGHQVMWYVRHDKEGNHNRIGDGLIQKIRDWNEVKRKWIHWADLILLTDNTYYLQDLEYFRSRDYPIIGPNMAAAELELDREKGMQALREVGIDCAPYKEFRDYDAAIAYVKKTGKRLVSKPSGDADKALSYVSNNAADMVFMLQRWKKLGKLKAPFILQDFVGGIEMAVGGWFGPHGFNHMVCENFEHKKLMNDNKGVNTGEMGTAELYVPIEKSRLAQELLVPATPILHDINYTGYVDLACIITDDGTIMPLEWTCRPGWPLFNIQQALHEGDPVAWMKDLVEGRDTLKTKKDCAVGIVLAMPDFPYSKLTKKEVTGFPVYGLEPPIMHHIHPCEMMAGTAPMMVGDKVHDLPCMVTAGDYVLVVSNTAPTVSQAAKKAYAIMDQVKMPNSPIYRTDIGRRLQKELPLLHKLGYAKNWSY